VTECSSKSTVQSFRALMMACFNWRQGIHRNIQEIQTCPWRLSRYIHSLRNYSDIILHSASVRRGRVQTWYSLRNLESSLQLPTIGSTQERGMTRIDRYADMTSTHLSRFILSVFTTTNSISRRRNFIKIILYGLETERSRLEISSSFAGRVCMI
jgi:hypothetical protein